MAEGTYDGDAERLSVYVQDRGGTFDLRKIPEDESSDFYPRGRPTAVYRYSPPPVLDDGWQTATLEDVGLSRAGIEKFIQTIIDTPIDSASGIFSAKTPVVRKRNQLISYLPREGKILRLIIADEKFLISNLICEGGDFSKVFRKGLLTTSPFPGL